MNQVTPEQQRINDIVSALSEQRNAALNAVVEVNAALAAANREIQRLTALLPEQDPVKPNLSAVA